MIDGSHLPFEDNIARVQEVTTFAIALMLALRPS